MKYMLMIYDRQELYDTATPEQMETAMTQHADFYRHMSEHFPGFTSERLQVPNTATSLTQNARGDWLITDGPFPDVKESIGGFYVFDANDLDAAIDAAKHCPAWVGLELRPVFTHE
ncbi:MAG: YciI family protein [Thermomicrobiales bacterium]